MIVQLFKNMKLWLRENKPLPAKKVILMQNDSELPVPVDEVREILDEYDPRVLKAFSHPI